MTNREMMKLAKGDTVTWNDPDTDADCSRTDIICEIETDADAFMECVPNESDMVASIMWMDGTVTEAFASELS